MGELLQLLLDISGNHITQYGIYIPGQQYTVILWNELLGIILSFWVVILALKVRGLKRLLARARKESADYRRAAKKTVEDRWRVSTMREINLKLVMEAMEWFDQFRITYVDFNGEVTERVIEPLRIYSNEGSIYIHAFCFLRGEDRTFRTDRIIKIMPAYEYLEIGSMIDYSKDDMYRLMKDDIY